MSEFGLNNKGHSVLRKIWQCSSTVIQNIWVYFSQPVHTYTVTPHPFFLFFFLSPAFCYSSKYMYMLNIVRWLITSMLWSIRQRHFHFCTGSRHLIGGRGWWWEHKFLILVLSLSICCGGRWLLQCSWCLLSHTAFSLQSFLPPPSLPFLLLSLPCPPPLHSSGHWNILALPTMLGSSPPPPPPPPALLPLATAGHSHCSLNWPYSLSPCLHIILSYSLCIPKIFCLLITTVFCVDQWHYDYHQKWYRMEHLTLT